MLRGSYQANRLCKGGNIATQKRDCFPGVPVESCVGGSTVLLTFHPYSEDTISICDASSKVAGGIVWWGKVGYKGLAAEPP